MRSQWAVGTTNKHQDPDLAKEIDRGLTTESRQLAPARHFPAINMR